MVFREKKERPFEAWEIGRAVCEGECMLFGMVELV